MINPVVYVRRVEWLAFHVDRSGSCTFPDCLAHVLAALLAARPLLSASPLRQADDPDDPASGPPSIRTDIGRHLCMYAF